MNKIIDIAQLKNVTRGYKAGEQVIIAQCPACAEAGYDLNGQNHLIVFPNGAFGCVLNPGEEGAEHRKEILDLVGTTPEPSQPPRIRPKPINPIPTKITYIKLNIRKPEDAGEAA